MKTLATDSLFTFGPRSRPGRCHLRIHRLGPDRPGVVVVTELPGPGPSVTNAVEQIAAEVLRDHGIDAACVLWVERIPADSFGPERLSAVSFDRSPDGRPCRPSWRSITRAALEHVLGAELPG